MTRGNQRDTDRAKAQKKAQQLAKSGKKESGSSLQKRKEADAQALREKQLRKEAEKAATTGGGSGDTKK
ncbi:hypothetical protein AURDEDRAFT_155249 [Auricularia subglabra TFB-10046 SS5]|nr:hypothetical protein AURDEDRAFT_155249 [Auricularia subglabra TFB-10046 SS5]